MALNTFITQYGLFLLIFLAFPGFISIKVYEMFLPTSLESKDFSKSLFDAFAYGFFNFIIFFPIFDFVYKISNPKSIENLLEFNIQNFFIYILFILCFVLIPALIPVFFLWLRSVTLGYFQDFNTITSGLRKKPWDYIFSRKDPFWVIVCLKDGTFVGGIYDIKSRSTHHPIPEQIYIEEVYIINNDGSFGNRTENTDGIIIFGSEIKYIEFKKEVTNVQASPTI